MTKPKPKDQHRKPGTKEKPPDPETAGQVRGMVLANLPIEFIAKELKLSEKTLRKRYRAQIDAGRAKLLGAAATQLARFVYGAKAEYDDRGNMVRAEVKPEQAACFFALKTQGKKLGWSERTEHTGADGAPLFNDLDLSKLSGKELKQLTGLLSKCGVDVAA